MSARSRRSNARRHEEAAANNSGGLFGLKESIMSKTIAAPKAPVQKKTSAELFTSEYYEVNPACEWLKRRFGNHSQRSRADLFAIDLDVDFLVKRGLLIVVG